MSRKATDQVATIGIDIGKNSFHLMGLNDRSGSCADLQRHLKHCRFSVGKQTFGAECLQSAGERTFWRSETKVRCVPTADIQ